MLGITRMVSLVALGRTVRTRSSSSSSSTTGVDPLWLYLNSPRHKLAGVNQKALSPLAVAAAPTLVRTVPLPDVHAVLLTWSDGSAETVPLSFFAAHDSSPAALEAASLAATPAALGSGASRVLLPTPRPAAQREAEGRAAVAGVPVRALPLHPVVGKDRIPRFALSDVVGEAPAHLHALLRAVNEVGLAIVDGAGTAPGTVLRLSSRLGFAPSLPTIYGATWEVKAEARPINIANQSRGLDLHVDLAYYESPPGLQLLHCRQFDADVAGGESTFVDAFHAAEVLRVRDQLAFDVLARVPCTFEKVHFDRPQPVLMRFQRPHLCVRPPSWTSLASPPDHGTASTASTGVVTSVFWAPMFEGVLRVHPDDLVPYYRAYAVLADILADIENDGRMLIEYRAEPGEIAVFNNRRMLHGRRGFEGGGRRLLEGCYVSADEWKSRYAVLTRRLEGEWGLARVKRVGNSDNSL
jgi:alpha-ketoglutarate-dependent taurine dioxygenase